MYTKKSSNIVGHTNFSRVVDTVDHEVVSRPCEICD